MMLPRIALTPGEPAGIGPDLCVMLAQQPMAGQLVAVADPQLLQRRAALLGLPLQITRFDPHTPATPNPPGSLPVLSVALAREEQCGRLDSANSGYVLETLRVATRQALDGHFQALVTGPVHKGVINEAGHPFTGHTEYLAQLCQSEAVMMLATEGLRVALATTHLPLSQVSAQITRERLERVIRTLVRDLSGSCGIARPRILVCGLNPHAGEDGHLGREEIEVIEPVLESLRAEGIRLTGPLPADTLFTQKYLRRADVVLAMYHDQGLPVLKHMGFGQAVNITLGLPVVRVSVDHGTALDLAGSGDANPGSLQQAVAMAIRMAENRILSIN